MRLLTRIWWGKRGDEGSWKAFINRLSSLFLKKSEVRGAGGGVQAGAAR